MPVWRDYEQEIYEVLRAKADDDARVEFDEKLPGHLSGTTRQIDVFVEGRFAGDVLPKPSTLAVDCKCWSSTVNVPDVERFIGLVDDVRTDYGLLITTVGFSKAAQRRADNARGLQIEVITFEQLKDWRPNVDLCQVCEVGANSMPGMLYLERLAPDEHPIDERVFVGRCDRCQAVHMLCSCGTLNGVYEGAEGDDLECEGCGRTFTVDPPELDSSAVPINDSPHQRVRVTAADVGGRTS